MVAELRGNHCAIIDSVLGYDAISGRTETVAADRVIDFIREHGFAVDWLLETHAHADHLTASQYLKEKLGGRIGIGDHVTEVQEIFKKFFNLEDSFPVDGSQFDCLLNDGKRINIGSMEVEVMHTPGHTPACVTYVIGNAAFVGDTLFMPDFGTARTDFPGGDAAILYRSIQRILSLPPETRLFMCHDYGPGGRDPKWETTVKEEKSANVHVHDGVGEEEFVKISNERDETLDVPILILPSVQVNIRAGRFPEPESNGVSYLKVPLNLL